MKLKVLVGAGDRIISFTLPFIVLGLGANIAWPRVFTLGLDRGGIVAAVILLLVGVPVWLSSVALVLINVPKKKLITTGPYAVLPHPMYTSVALLVLPGCGLLFDSWVGVAMGIALYVFSRVFSPVEETILAQHFSTQYAEYRRRILIPWI